MAFLKVRNKTYKSSIHQTSRKIKHTTINNNKHPISSHQNQNPTHNSNPKKKKITYSSITNRIHHGARQLRPRIMETSRGHSEPFVSSAGNVGHRHAWIDAWVADGQLEAGAVLRMSFRGTWVRLRVCRVVRLILRLLRRIVELGMRWVSIKCCVCLQMLL